MTLIFYGVAGEGNGHAIRSKVVVDHLEKNHQVQLYCGGNAHSYLSRYYKVKRITSMRFVHKNNAVDIGGTLFYFLTKIPEIIQSFRRVLKDIDKHKPQIIISDMDPILNYAAIIKRIPCISMSYPFLNTEYLREHKKIVSLSTRIDYWLTMAINKALNPSSKKQIIPTFLHKSIKDEDSIIVPPVIRQRILTNGVKEKNHVLVYQTHKSNTKLLTLLKQRKEQYYIYGFGARKKDKNLTFFDFSDNEFVDHLLTAKAVIGNGGFSLMSECAALQKPLLAFPVKNRYEQYLDGWYLRERLYGHASGSVKMEALDKFFDNLDTYKTALKKYKQQNNSLFFQHIDKLVQTFKLTT